MLVNRIDYEFMAFPRTKDVDLYRDDFDSDSEHEVKGEPTLHGFELAKFVFEQSHADMFQMQESHDFLRKLFDQGLKKTIQL